MPQVLRALIVDDVEDDALLVTRALRQAGHEIQWRRVETADETRAALSEQAWHVMLADACLPRFSAAAVLALLAELDLDLPVIVVSGTLSEEQAVAVMKAGAHDFVLKDNLARLAPAVTREVREAAIRQERRAAEAAIRASEERYRMVAWATSDIISDWDSLTGAVTWNDAVERVLGYHPAAVPATIDEAFAWWQEILHPNDRARIEASFRAALASADTTWSAEYRLRRADGTHTAILARVYIARDDQGQPTRIVAAWLDVTERQRAEAAIRESEERYRLVTHATNVQVWDWDLRADRVVWNEAMEAAVGRRRAELPVSATAAAEWWFTRIPLHARDHTRANFARLLESDGSIQVNEHPFRRADGAMRTHLSHVYVQRDENQAPVRLVGAVLDITERKQAEERQRLLADIAQRFAEGHDDWQAALGAIAERLATAIGDSCSVRLLSEDRQWLQLTAIHHRNPERVAQLRALFDQHPQRVTEGANGLVVRTGEPLLLSTFTQHDHHPERERFSQRFPTHSLVIVPLRAHGRILGALSLRRDHLEAPYTAADQDLLQALADRIALGLDNARLYQAARLAQAEAETERQRLRRLFAQAPAKMALLRGPDHVFEMANAEYLRATGRRDVIGRPVREVFPELAEQGFLAILDEVFATGQSYHGTEVLIRLDRSGLGVPEPGWFTFVYQARRDAAGAVEGILVHALETTQTVLARQEVERLNEELEWRVDESTAALAQAERAAARIARLQQVTAALAGALTREQVAAVLFEHGMAALQAQAGAIVLREGDYLTVVHATGFPEDRMYDDRRIPLTSSIPIADAILTGEPVWLGSIEAAEARYPGGSLFVTIGYQAVALVPLRVGEQVVGGLSLCFVEEQDFGPEDRTFIMALTQQCAQALDRA